MRHPEAPAHSQGLYLRTFGGVALENGGRPLSGAASQRGRLAILSVLATAGPAGCSRDKLLALFWPESSEERARGALKQALYAVRRDVGERELLVGTTELRLNPEVITSDVGAFTEALARDALEEAVALYAGPFLDGVLLKDLADFEEWVERERQRLQAAYRTALEELARQATDRGDVVAAAGWWRRRAAEDRLSARVARAYMEALVAAGDREAALRHGAIYQKLVEAELGTAPDSELVAYLEQLRASGGSSAVRAKPPSGAAASPASSPESLPTVLPTAATNVPRVASAVRTSPQSAKPRRLRWRASLVALVLVGSSLTAMAVSQRTFRGPTRPTSVPLVTVSVLPFVVEDSSREVAALASIARDAVIAALAPYTAVAVVTVGSPADEALVRRARIRYVVRGRVGLIGQHSDSLAVRATIVDITNRDGAVVLAPAVSGRTRPHDALKSLQRRVVAVVAGAALSRDYGGRNFSSVPRAAYAPPPSIGSFLSYVDAIEVRSEEEYPRAIELARAAYAQDSDYIVPQLFEAKIFQDWGYCDSSMRILERLGSRSLLPAEQAVRNMRAATCNYDVPAYAAAEDRLWSIDPQDGIYRVNAAVFAGNLPRADSLIRALRITPTAGDFIWQHLTNHAFGRYAQDLAVLDTVARDQTRRPLNEGWRLMLQAEDLAAMGREADVDQTLSAFDAVPATPEMDLGRALTQTADEYAAHGFDGAANALRSRAAAWYRVQGADWISSPSKRWRYALALLDVDSLANAITVARPLLTEPNEQQWIRDNAHGLIGLAATRTGDRTARAKEIEWLSTQSTRFDRGNTVMWRARIALALGRHDEAFALAGRALADGYPRWEWFGGLMWLEPLHHLPEFAALETSVEP